MSSFPPSSSPPPAPLGRNPILYYDKRHTRRRELYALRDEVAKERTRRMRRRVSCHKRVAKKALLQHPKYQTMNEAQQGKASEMLYGKIMPYYEAYVDQETDEEPDPEDVALEAVREAIEEAMIEPTEPVEQEAPAEPLASAEGSRARENSPGLAFRFLLRAADEAYRRDFPEDAAKRDRRDAGSSNDTIES